MKLLSQGPPVKGHSSPINRLSGLFIDSGCQAQRHQASAVIPYIRLESGAQCQALCSHNREADTLLWCQCVCLAGGPSINTALPLFKPHPQAYRYFKSKMLNLLLEIPIQKKKVHFSCIFASHLHRNRVLGHANFLKGLSNDDLQKLTVYQCRHGKQSI